VSVFSLGPEQIEELWPRFGHHIERLERETGLVLASEVRDGLIASHKQLFGWQEGERILGIAVTEIRQTPKGPCCWVIGAAGTESRKGQIDAIIASIEAWAKGIGCSRVMLEGRRGWLRRLNNYRQVGIVLEKEF
jgi:hypothetical protein